jgi:hypothetical protein
MTQAEQQPLAHANLRGIVTLAISVAKRDREIRDQLLIALKANDAAEISRLARLLCGLD